MIFRKRARAAKKSQPVSLETQIEALAKKPESELTALAQSDAQEALREAAIALLSYGPALLALAQNQDSGRLQQAARKRLGELLETEQLSLNQLRNDLPDSQQWLTIGSHSVRTSEQLLAQISEPAEFLHLAIHGATIQIRQAAADKLHSRTELEQLCKAAQGRDKTVYRLAKSRLDEFKANDARQAEREAQGRLICEKLQQLARVPSDPLYAAKLDKLEQDWQALAQEQLPPELQNQHREVLNKCHAPLRAEAEARAELQTQEARREELTRSAVAAKNQADSLLCALYTAEGETLGEETFPTQVQSLQAALQALEDLPETEQSALKARLDSAEQLLNYLREHGSLVALTDALAQSQPGADEREKQALRQALKASRDLKAPLPEQVQAATELLQQREASAKEAAQARRKQLRELEQLARRGLAAANGGRVRQARGIHHASLEQRAAAGELPSHLSAQLEKLDEAIERLSDWHEFAVTPKKHALIEQMQQLVGSPMAPEDLARKIHDLQDDWKLLSKGVPHADEELWQQFQAASKEAFVPCREFFEAQAKEREENLAHRDRLIEQLQTYLDGYDWDNPVWKDVERTFKQAREEWRTYWPVPRQAAKAQEARFEPLMDQLHGKLTEAYDSHKAAKEQLVAQAQRLTEEENLNTAIEGAKQLQTRWKAVGKCRPRDDAQLWKTFRRHCDAIFARREEEHAAANQARQAQLDQARDIIAHLQSLLEQDASELRGQRDTIRTLKGDFDGLNQLPRAQAPKVKAELHKVLSAIDQKLEQERVQAKERQWQKLHQANAALHQAEVTVLRGKDSAEGLANAQTAMESVEQLPGNSRELLQERLNNAQQIAPKDQQASEERLGELCIRADILAGVESPADERQARMNYQMQLLQKGLGQAAQDSADALLMDWLSLRGLNNEQYEAGLKRLKPVLLGGR
jgi:DNA repair protein SbcC/Rad50